jgi:hypothetical protein
MSVLPMFIGMYPVAWFFEKSFYIDDTLLISYPSNTCQAIGMTFLFLGVM